MMKQTILWKSGKVKLWLCLLLFILPTFIQATNIYQESCWFSTNARSSTSFQTETILSNWFQFKALANITTLKLSKKNNTSNLYLVYNDAGVLAKGAIFESSRTFDLATLPGETYYILQIDDEVDNTTIDIQIEPGKIQRLSKEEKGRQPDVQGLPDAKSILNGPDCDQATTLCNSTDIAYNPTGSGANDFTGGNADGCLNGENLSAWYYFEFSPLMPSGTSIEFSINPDGGDDYDFAVWGPNVSCGSLGSPIRCSYSSNGFTGLMDGSGDNSEGPGGNGFVEDIQVNPGDGFYLMIDNFSTSFSGFTLTWDGSAAPYLDCSAIPPEAECGMSANATPNGSTNVCSGQIVFLSGSANNGSGPLTYSWLATPAYAQSYIESPNQQTTIVAFPEDAAGNFTFTFTAMQTTDGCVATSNIVYMVSAGEQPNLDSFADVCDSDPPISLNQFQDDVFGNWSGQNVGGNSFNPAGLSGTIPLIFTPNPGQCSATDTAYINVGSSIPISLDAIPEMCPSDDSFSLPTTQSGQSGNWSGTGVQNNVFDPSGLSGNITLTFTPTLSCGQPATTQVVITNPEDPNLDDFGPLCEDDEPIFLPETQDGIEGTWSIDGLEESEFNPEGHGGEDVVLTFTPHPDECANETTTTVMVTFGEEPILESFEPICPDAAAIILETFQDGVEGNWSGTGVTNNTFNPNGLSGNINLTFTPNPGQCAVEAFTSIEITEGEPPALTPLQPICEDAAALSLPTSQDNITGNWSGTGVMNNTFNPNGLSGNINLTFTPNPGQCAVEVFTSIEITEGEPPALTPLQPICEDAATLSLPTFQDGVEGNWSGTGVMNNTFNPNGLSGNVPLTFIPNPGQCAAEATTSIMINEPIVPNLDALAPICESDNPVSLATNQDGIDGVWSGDGVFNNEFTPTGQNGSIILTFTPIATACAVANTATIQVDTEPTATLSDNSLSTCNVENTEDPEATIVNLEALIIAGDINGTWQDTDNSGVDMSDVSALNFDGIPPSQTYTFTYTITSVNGTCPPQSYTVDVFVQDCACPSVATSSAPTLCNLDGVLDLSTLEDTDEEGTWVLISSPAGNNSATLNGDIFDATQSDAGEYEVSYVLDTEPLQGCPPSSNQIIMVENAAPPALTNFPAVCNQDAAFALPTIQSGIAGSWSGSGVNNNMFDPANQSDTIPLTFTPNDGPCASIAMTTILVNTATAPALDDLGTICESGDAINLPTSQSGVMGNWSGIGVSANQFNPMGLDGDITLTFEPIDGACAIANTGIITVSGVFMPALEALPDFCQADPDFSLPTMQDGVTGDWSGQGVQNNNQFNPMGLSGDITLTFTPTNSDCASPNTVVTNITPIATPSLDSFAALCEDGTALALPNVQNTIAGTWSGSGVSTAGDEFNPMGLSGEITLTFTPLADECAVENSTTIQVDIFPFATLSTDELMTCSTASEGSIVDLAALVIDGDTNGTWADTDGAGVNVSNPSNVDFENVADGNYIFTYTTNGNSTCPEASYTVSISVSTCLIDCPDVSTNPPTAPLCNMEGSLNLSTLVNTEEPGTWAITNTPTGTSPATLTGTMFNADNADAGMYEVTYTIVNTIDQCAASSSQTIIVEAQPFAVLSTNTTNTCNASADGSILDFTSFIIDGDANGTWTDDSGAGVNLGDYSAVDFNGVAPDVFYSFTYTTNNATASCPAASYTLEVFVENCACPSVALINTDPLCNGGGTIDLSTLQITNQTGTWSIVNSPVGANPAVLNGTLLDVTNADAGDYQLRFTLTETPEPPCPAFNSITISVDGVVSAGVPNAPTLVCNTENTIISLANEISNENAGGQWIETSALPSQGNAYSAGNATFNPNGQLAGTYTFAYRIGDTNSACATDEATVTIMVAPAPVADAGLNQQLTCHENSFTLGGSNTTGDRFEWTDANGNLLGNTATITVAAAGTYTLTTFSDAGCMDTDMVTVAPEAAPLNLTVEPIPPGCEDTTGSLIISDASGGTMPYTFGLQGEVISGISELTNLLPGTYTVNLLDNLGCQTETTVTIPEPMVVIVDLGIDQNVVWGDSTELTVNTNAGPDASIVWSNPELLSCFSSCATTIATPLETTRISVTVTDISGCTASDDILLLVDQRPQIYPPTAFSPNDDEFNDFFMIFTGSAVKSFDRFQIFNRWGELVYEDYNLEVNGNRTGWDGHFQGKKVNPEVFVWVAEFTLIDGSKILEKGDVTVVR